MSTILYAMNATTPDQTIVMPTAFAWIDDLLADSSEARSCR